MHYIHLEDNGFPNGFRRLGPYDKKQADIQAKHDRDLGLPVLGVFPAKESDKAIEPAEGEA